MFVNITSLAAVALLLLPINLLYARSVLKVPKAQWVSAASTGTLRVAATQTLSNDYVAVSLDDTGHFTIGTVAGDTTRTSDNNKKLLFGHPSPGTSDTYVRIDGVSSSLHGGTASAITQSADSLSMTLTVGTLQVLQRLRLVASAATGNADAVEIYFRITNTDSVSHNVGLRTQLDTQLGDNDGAPFRVPQVGEVTTDIEFDNDAGTASIGNIPAQALVLDSLVSPTVIAQLSFRGLGYRTPDRVVLGYWPDSVGAWDYVVNPANSFLDNDNDGTIDGSSPDSDSSVVVWWGYPDGSAISLAAGESVELAIQYGIGNCVNGAVNGLNMLFCSPVRLEGRVSGSTFEYPPIAATAFITNTTAADIGGARVKLNLPPDLRITSGAQDRPVEGTDGSGILTAGSSDQADWEVTSNGRYMGRRPLSVTLIHGGSLRMSREIVTHSIANTLYGQATDASGNTLSGVTITALSGSTVVGSAITQADGTYVITGLNPGRYTVRLSAAGQPDSYYEGEVSAAGGIGRTANPGQFSAGANLETYAYPNPARDNLVRIAYYSDGAATPEIKIFSTTGRLIKTFTALSSGAGWNTVEWAIDDVANGVYFYQVSAGSSRETGKIAILKRRPR